jgi:hypothetical protein
MQASGDTCSSAEACSPEPRSLLPRPCISRSPTAGNQITPAALQALNALDNTTWLAYNTGFGVMMLGAAGCLWQQAGVQLALGRIALVLGVLLFVPFVDFLALLVTLLWILVTSVALYRADRATSSSVAVPAT